MRWSLRNDDDDGSENGKRAIGLDKQNNVARASRFFVHFSAVAARLGSLSKGVYERRTSTGSEVFSLLTCLDDIKFLFLSFFTVIEAI